MNAIESLSFMQYYNGSICWKTTSCNYSQNSESLQDGSMLGDDLPLMNVTLSIIYSLVCAVGLVGNVLVLILLWTGKATRKSSVNVFVFNLATNDLQFVLTLPFWAIEMALDFRWPFGAAMCKLVTSVTVLSVYGSVYFLTAICITRYVSIASALKPQRQLIGVCKARLISVLIWLVGVCTTIPTAVFATTEMVHGDVACLLKFPENGLWLGVYHLHKMVIGFLIPLAIIIFCYVQLVLFLSQKNFSAINSKRHIKVSKSVIILVLCFFTCWLPYHVITFWGILVKLNMIEYDEALHFVQTYIFPVTICLAYSNSCLNPVIYCLMRREFRKALKSILWRLSTSTARHSCLSSVGYGRNTESAGAMVPLKRVDGHSLPASQSYTKKSTLPFVITTTMQKNPGLTSYY
ncbi:relaxin-3 receptor 1-like [Polypterus senegalus]